MRFWQPFFLKLISEYFQSSVQYYQPRQSLWRRTWVTFRWRTENKCDRCMKYSICLSYRTNLNRIKTIINGKYKFYLNFCFVFVCSCFNMIFYDTNLFPHNVCFISKLPVPVQFLISREVVTRFIFFLEAKWWICTGLFK